MAENILILGGTREAANLAEKLVQEGHQVTTSLAGRTREPLPLAGETRSGGFGGVDGLARYIRENGVTRLIDATHPFATQISANARSAATLTGVNFEEHTRPSWQRRDGDNWIEVDSLEAASDAIPSDARVLLALGSQHIAVFASRDDVHFVVRMVDAPEEPLPLPDHSPITGRPGNLQSETALLRKHNISHIVSRNSGGEPSYSKIQAARELGLIVIMIQRNDN